MKCTKQIIILPLSKKTLISSPSVGNNNTTVEISVHISIKGLLTFSQCSLCGWLSSMNHWGESYIEVSPSNSNCVTIDLHSRMHLHLHYWQKVFAHCWKQKVISSLLWIKRLIQRHRPRNSPVGNCPHAPFHVSRAPPLQLNPILCFLSWRRPYVAPSQPPVAYWAGTPS